MHHVEKLCNILYVLLFGILLIVVMGSMFTWSFRMAWILPIFVALFIIYITKKKRILKEEWCSVLWYIVYGACLVFLIAFSFLCEVAPSWDWGQVLESASEYVLNGTLDAKEYYARYTNNQLCLICMVTLFQWIRFALPDANFVDFQEISIVISCIFVWLSIGMIYLIAKKVWGRRRACIAGMLAAGCLPLYMYAQFLYTDTPGMLLLTIQLYLGICIYKSHRFYRKLWLGIVLGIVAGITYHIKVIPFIVFLAIVIALFLQKERWYQKCILLLMMCLTLGGVIQCIGVYSDQYAEDCFGITDAIKDEWEYPLTHWIMMGLNEKSDGGYMQDDVAYTATFETRKERTEENVRVILARLRCFGAADYIQFIFFDKMPRTWGDSCFAGDDYLFRMPYLPECPLVQIMKWNGTSHSYCLIYTWTYYVILFFGIVLSGLLALGHRGRQDPMMIGRIAMIGIALFQILWECNSRYVITFLPMMILMALDGYFTCKQRLTQAD